MQVGWRSVAAVAALAVVGCGRGAGQTATKASPAPASVASRTESPPAPATASFDVVWKKVVHRGVADAASVQVAASARGIAMAVASDGARWIEFASHDGGGWSEKLPVGCEQWSLTGDDTTAYVQVACPEDATARGGLPLPGRRVLGFDLASGALAASFEVPHGTTGIVATGERHLLVTELTRVTDAAVASSGHRPAAWSADAYESQVELVTAAGKRVWRTRLGDGRVQLRIARVDRRGELWFAGTAPCLDAAAADFDSIFVGKAAADGRIRWAESYACAHDATAIGGWRETERGMHLLGLTAMPPPVLGPPGRGAVAIEVAIDGDGELSVSRSRIVEEAGVATAFAAPVADGRTAVATARRCDPRALGIGQLDDRCGQVRLLGPDEVEREWQLTAPGGGVAPVAAAMVDGDLVIACVLAGELRIDGAPVMRVDQPSLVAVRIRP